MCSKVLNYQIKFVTKYSIVNALVSQKLKVILPTRIQLTHSFSSTHFPVDKISNLKKDVLLYSLEKTRVYKYISIFGIAQLAVWVFYAGTLFTNLRDVSKIEGPVVEMPKSSLWKRINLGDIRYRIVAVLACLSIGIGTAFITYTLPLRVIKALTLCKGGNMASIVTYAPFGRTTREFKVPLHQLSCLVSRKEATSYIPLKIKNTWFYYLVDCKGHFCQPSLFDFTVGTKSFKRN
ncbi:transmembrane protein 223-like [Stegodyphus dumicola]|uniref:transmembrane protein 223-like n=1 Tax=Stegodyphus dumicola TaxID=202533 RepID=UPI0015AE10C8|nr:transmembrane protein 223-like [Stegodyphus dumicola]